jgi:AcrR family transcriptional regulator
MSSPLSRASLRLTLDVGVRKLAKAQTRERIRQAAHDLFLTRGFADTTTQMVAEHAGVAVGTLFQHASDKEDLLLLVLHEPLAAAIKTATSQPDSDDVLMDATVVFGSLLEVYADLDRAARPALRAHWFGAGPNARAIQWLHETFLEQVVDRLQRAQQAGRLSDGADARTLASNLTGLYQAVLLAWLWGDEPLDTGVATLRSAFALQLIPLQTTTPAAPEGPAPRA